MLVKFKKREKNIGGSIRVLTYRALVLVVVVRVLVEVVVAVCWSCCVVGVLVTVSYVAYLNFVRIKM